MVSIRRRRLLGLCSGQNSFLAALPGVFEHGQTNPNSLESATPINVHSRPSSDGYKPKQETALETRAGPSNVSAHDPSTQHHIQQFPEIKRRKRHRRKQIENQEPCIMRGVYFKNMKWQAAIKVDKKQIHLGTVGSQEEAARLYDRAAFMCGREPNFELTEEEKKELRKVNWEEFLAITRTAISNKKTQRRTTEPGPGRRVPENDDWEGERGGRNGLSVSEEDDSLPS